MLALWTAHAHAFEAFVHTPRLNLCSPEKHCGKTTALDVLASMTPRPLRTESMTAAVLFRLVEQYKPTLLLDEVDAYLNEAEELRGLLNAGHKRGAKPTGAKAKTTPCAASRLSLLLRSRESARFPERFMTGQCYQTRPRQTWRR